MRRYLLLCFVFCAQQLYAQHINVDSLIRVAIAHTNVNDIASKNHDSVFRAFTLANAGHQRTKIIYQLINNGQATSKFGLNYHYKILNWARKNNDRISEAIIMAEIAFQLSVNGDSAEALKMDQDALSIAVKAGDNEALGIVYDSMGCCYNSKESYSTADYKQILHNFRQGLKYSILAHNHLFISYDYGGMGAAYRLLNKPDSAIFFALKSFEHAAGNNITVQTVQSLQDMADVQTDKKLALKYLQASATVAKAGRVTGGLGNAYSLLATFYKTNGRPDSALFYAKSASETLKGQSVLARIAPAHLLMQLYANLSADSTLKYTNIYYSLRDSMFSIAKAERMQALTFSEEQRKQDIENQKAAYGARLQFYLLVVIITFFAFIAFIFWRNSNRNKKDKIQIQNALDKLKQTQTQLIQSEKMASLGELTAGIAHEIQNPLNFVNNFSDVNREMIDELKEELKAGNTAEAIAIADDIQQNEEKINHHGKRADFIVKGMLQHSRTSTGERQPTNINILADEFLKLSYHGLRAKDKLFNADMITHYDEALPRVNVVQQDIGRVLLNLFNNAFYAVNQKQKIAGTDYKPEVTVTTFASSLASGGWGVSVKDNGNGIPDAIKDKIMQPFFTTKPTGEGTGLGLSLSYDIVVKGHDGKIEVNTKEGEFTEFIVNLPNA